MNKFPLFSFPFLRIVFISWRSLFISRHTIILFRDGINQILVGISIFVCISMSSIQGGMNSAMYRVTNTRCRICTLYSPDDGHIVSRNMYRKAINVLRKYVHQVGSTYMVIQRCGFGRCEVDASGSG